MAEEKFVSYDQIIDSVKDLKTRMFLMQIRDTSAGNASPNRFVIKSDFVSIFWDLEEDLVIKVLVAEWGGHFYVNGQYWHQIDEKKPKSYVFDQISDHLNTYKRCKWLKNELGEDSARVKWSKDWMCMRIGPVTVYPFPKDDALITCRIGSINLEKRKLLNYLVHDLKSFMTEFPALQSE